MRLKQFFSVLLMLLTVNITAVWGEEITWSFKTLQVTSGTQNGITWETGKTGTATATACNSTNGLVLYGVSSGGGYFQTTTAIAGTITNVNIVSTAKKNTPKYTIYCSSNGTDWNSIEAGINAGTKDKAIDGSYTYLKIANTTAATAQLGVTSITITYTPSGSVQTAGSMTPNLTSVEVGQEGENNGSISIAYSGITDMTNVGDVKIYSDAEHTIEITNTIDWLVADWNSGKTAVEYVVEANTGAERTAYIYLYALDDNDNEVEKVIPVTQAEYVAPFEGLKLTFDVSSNPGAWPTSNSTTTTNYTYTLNEVDYTFALNNVKCNSGYLMLTSTAKLGLPAISGYKLVKVEAKNSSGCSTSTKVKVSSDVNGENVVSGGSEQTWATQSSTYTYTLTGTEENTMYYLYVSNKNCQITELVLYYVEAEAAAVATPSISGEDNFLNSTEVSMTCATEGAAIYYTTTESAKATPATSGDWAAYDSENKPSFSATTTVWAAAKKDAAWSAVAEKTFTKATVLSVAEALEAATGNNQYVKGIIASIDEVSTEHGNATYNLKDEGQANSIKIYRGKYLDNAEFTAADQIYVGDEVTVFGNISQYQSVNQFAQGNYIVAIKPIARLAWSATSYEAEIDGTNNYPTLTNTNSVTVTYSSSNTAAATIDASTGEISLVAEGTTTITATFAGNETYKANSASYTMNVAAAVIRADISFDENGGSAVTDLTQQSNLPNPLPATTKAGKNFGGWYTDSEFNTPAVAGAAVASTDAITLYAKWLEPYTVAEALTLIDALDNDAQTDNSVYVAGIVCTAPTANPNSGALTFYISADGTETSRLQAYKIKDLSNENFSSKTDIQTWDEVVIYGPLKKYIKNEEVIPEFNTGYLYSFSRKQDSGIAWTADEAEATIGEENTFPNLTNDNAVAVTYSSSETDYATIDASTGEITLVAAGQTSITATFAGDATYKAASVSYTLTVKPVVVHGSITYVENGGETVDDVADATELPNPLPTTTKDGHKFLGWYTDSELTTPAVAGAALTGNITLYAAWEEISAWAYEYNSNVTISSSESKKVIISNVEYDAAKTNKGTAATITLPLNTTKIHMHLVAWNGDANSVVTVTGACFNDAIELTLADNANVSGSSNYDLGTDATMYYFSLTPDNAVAADEVITISAASGKRFVLFGVNQEGGVLPVLDHIIITGEATNLEYEAGDVFDPAGLGVEAVYTLNEVAQPAEAVAAADIEWSFDPATLTTETTSVTVTATVDGKSANKVVTGLTITSATPEITVAPGFINFGSVELNDEVAAKTIDVTLKSVAAATVTLSGTGASAFSLDKAALTENGTITVTPVTTTAGTYNATITISDDAAAATDATVTVMMTVVLPDTEDDLTGTWTLVTDAAQLTAGKKVIVAEYVSEDGAAYTMSTQNNNNRTAVESTVAGTTLTPAEGTRVLTVEVPEEGKFALKTNRNMYLYAASSSNNYLKEQETLNDNGKWTITIADGKAAITAQGTMTHNLMRYNNTGTARLFSCYASGQKDIALYMLEESDPEPVYTEVRNGLAIGRFYTICLNQEFSAVRGATLWDIENGNNDEITLIEAVLSGNNAGRPYIFLATAATMEVVYGENTTTTAGSNNGLHGTFETLTENQLDGKYILSENQLWYVDVTGGSANVTLAPYRAYLNKSEVPSQSAEGDAPARRRIKMAINNPSHTPTGIDVVNMQAEGVQKVVIDGNLYIVRDGRMYDTTGRLVK